MHSTLNPREFERISQNVRSNEEVCELLIAIFNTASRLLQAFAAIGVIFIVIYFILFKWCVFIRTLSKNDQI